MIILRKILIVAINAKYIHSNLAAYSLRAYALKHLREEGHQEVEIEIAEYTINQYAEQILKDVYQRKPDLVAFSCYIWNIEMVERIVSELKKVLPDVDLWLGGPEVSFHTKHVLNKLPVRGVMVGEGERTFLGLIRIYLNAPYSPHTYSDTIQKNSESGDIWLEKSLQKLDGIVCDSFTTRVSSYMDINELPFPYAAEYMEIEDFENRIIYYESSRGCPFSCTYCLSSIDKTVRLRDFALVKQELTFFLEHRVRQVKFIDRTFNCNHRHAIEIWDFIKKNDNGVTNFHFEIAADLLTDEELDILSSMRPGLAQLEIGVQSVNEVTIQEIDRRTDFVKIARVVNRLREGHNIHLHLDLIAGLPKEDYDKFVISFNAIFALHPNQLQLGFLKVLKGSPMAERAESYGIIYTSYPPYEVLSTKWLTYDDILQLKAVEEMLEMYYNSSQFVYTMSLLEQAFPDGYSLFRELARYYEKSGYHVNQPSRLKRYEILYEFAKKYDREHMSLYRESLILDLYLRENLKSRPSFLQETKENQEQIQKLYHDEMLLREYLPGYQKYELRQISRMTHMEVFHHWNKIHGKMKCTKKESSVYILFDYQIRDPLTQDAYTVRIEASAQATTKE